MTISLQTTIGELASAIPHAARVFEAAQQEQRGAVADGEAVGLGGEWGDAVA